MRLWKPADVMARKSPILAAIGVIWVSLLLFAFTDPLGLLHENWLITPAAFFAAAFANATAVGGGFIFIPLFALGYGLPALVALKLSLATQAFGMSAGVLGWSAENIRARALLYAASGNHLGRSCPPKAC